MLSAEYVDARLHASPRWCALAVLALVLAGTALWQAELSLPLRLGLLFAIVLTLLDAGLRHGVRWHPRAVVAFRGSPERLRVTLGNGDVVDARLAAPVVVTPGFAGLTLACGRRMLKVVVFADAMHPAAFRRLKVFLKLARGGERTGQPKFGGMSTVSIASGSRSG